MNIPSWPTGSAPTTSARSPYWRPWTAVTTPSTDCRDDGVYRRAVSGIVGDVGEPQPSVAPNHEVAAALVDILVCCAPHHPARQRVSEVRRKGTRCECPPPGGASHPVGAVHCAGLINETGERELVATTVPADTSLGLKPDDKHLRVIGQLVQALTQLRQVLKAVQSPEPAQEHQHDRPAGKL